MFHHEIHGRNDFEDTQYWVVDVGLAVAGSLSAAGSFLVLLTGVVFWKHMVTNKIYMQMIMMLSMSLFFASIMSAFGVPKNFELCEAQSAIVNFFFRAAWAWATLIIFMLYSYMGSGKMKIQFLTMNIILWGVVRVGCTNQNAAYPLSTWK